MVREGRHKGIPNTEGRKFKLKVLLSKVRKDIKRETAESWKSQKSQQYKNTQEGA